MSSQWSWAVTIFRKRIGTMSELVFQPIFLYIHLNNRNGASVTMKGVKNETVERVVCALAVYRAGV